ncbi:MAG: coiled-coil protein [Candidatus Kariarchaeaceae archaeon]
MILLAAGLTTEIDSKFTGREKLRKLRDMKRELIDQVREIEAKRAKLRTERDKQNQSVKELFEEARVSREKRDEVNEDVKLNKALRDLRKEDADKTLTELEKLEEKMKDMGINPKGRGKRRGIAKQIRELEMKIETTGNLNPTQEKELIDRIEKLTGDIGQLEVADEKRDEIRVIQKRLRTLRGEALSHHKEVKKLASQSQDYHDVMLEKIKEARGIRIDADKNHKEVVETSEKIKELRKEINGISSETDKIRKQLGEETAAERKKRRVTEAKQREEDLSDQATKVLERYKAGEKLGFEEFKLLISRGLLNE